ncbi:MAG: hypothetical protein JWM53_5157 [bacterium]|nr:hypothetical protein [bacterium]
MTTRRRDTDTSENASFVRRVRFNAPPARVFNAITTLDGLRGWWTPFVQGEPLVGGDVRFEFEGLSQHIIMHVDEATPTSSVRWTCRIHSELPEWRDTRVIWDLQPAGRDSCELRLEHAGLTPHLECYDHCEVGWDHFLASVVAYVERGAGTPYRSSGTGTCETRKVSA